MVALSLRYVFAVLGVLIVAYTYLWLLKERREGRRRLHQLPDAGTVGRLLVLDGGDSLPEGMELTLPCEGTLGAMRTCDVVIPSQWVAQEHLDFSFRDQAGLLLYPRRGTTCTADGEELTPKSRP